LGRWVIRGSILDASMRWNKFFAWCVHGYTALGLLAAGGMAVALLVGGPASFRLVFALMMLATVIDATDGTLARYFRVKEVLPGFDGRRLDDLIDFHTYTSLPLLLIWRAELLPDEAQWCLLVALVASAYGFCQVHAKTDDGYFLGFPSYWNVIAFYLYVVQPAPWFSAGIVLFFALLTFVPARYIYPSHRGRLNRLSSQLGAVWCILLILIVARLPESLVEGQTADRLTRLIAWISLTYPAYYLAVSWFISVRLVLRARRMRAHVGWAAPSNPATNDKLVGSGDSTNPEVT
jgi:phosphatidylcholine synthase